MAESKVELREHNGIAYRDVLPAGGADDAPVALLVHGYPESSYMWRHVLPTLAGAGWRAIAPDLLGFGDTAADPPATWERQVEAIERMRTGLAIEHAALVVHDWGGLIGLRWACDHPGVATAIVISSTGFFSDGKWHGMAQALRTEGQGEQLVEAIDRDGFGAVLKQSSAGMTNEALDEYFKAYGDADRRRGQLELYRSGDFEKLQPYEGKLAALGVPVLLLWGEDDPFAPVAGAKRFEAELPDTRLVVIEGAGHFVVEDSPERYAREVVEFLQDVARG